MKDESHDWRGEHLIRCQKPEDDRDTDTRVNDLDLRRKKVARLINLHLTASQIAQRLGVSESVVYKDAAKLQLKLTGATAQGPMRKAS